ncbi:PAS domain-containing protein [Candidatus Kaiserbacteria bacterium]|nr:PAS domain-containing protein [Candidatus Kaiserbacteria bacterium]
MKKSLTAKTKDNDANKPVFVVGIGASAGGLEAITGMLKHVPQQTGSAYVYVQHLDPTHESMLTELLSRAAAIPVVEASDGMPVEPDHLYVIPPGKSMTIARGVLHVALRKKDDRFATVDHFFRALASDQKDRAVGVVLSGNASDGAAGLKAIKAKGGVTFAQDEASAKYASMPESAIASGVVDHVLAPAQIAQRIVHMSKNPSAIAPTSSRLPRFGKDEEKPLQKIFALLHTATSANFSQYKPATLKRRIARRMNLNHMEHLSEYVTYLERDPQELERLFQDILINVTDFFRDPEIFDFLKKKIFPALIKGRAKDAPLRIWVAGCSTGEEVYSLAIALVEFFDTEKQRYPIQLFGTDLNETMVEKARKGIYSKNITETVSPARLRRFFTEVDGCYRINKTVRDMCVFAKQDLTRDPPFSQLDLISCRNVFIYLESSVQKKIFPIFHYALKPGAYLMLGKSETVGEFTDMFQLQDKAHKLYAKKDSPTRPRFAGFAPDRSYIRKDTAPKTAARRESIRIPHETDLSKEIHRLLLALTQSPARVTGRKRKGLAAKKSGEVETLEQELAALKENLNAVLEEQGATNEEFQSANEELQSINEELETAKEELQSTNEELITVNDELQTRNIELNQVNNDLLNVLASASVPMIIVDSGLRIRRFTPLVQKHFRIIPSDVGRPITDIKLPIHIPDLEQVLLRVIDTVQSERQDVADEEGRWYNLWIRPYKTADNKIDGAILTLIEITEAREQQEKIQKTLSYVEAVLRTMREPFLVLDETMHVVSTNEAFYRVFKASPADTEGKLIYEIGNRQWDTPRLRQLLEKVLSEKGELQDVQVEHDFPYIGRRVMLLNARRLVEEGDPDRILLSMSDITERKLLEESESFARRNALFVSMASHELKTPVTTIKTLLQLLERRFEGSDDATLREYLARMSQHIDQMMKIVNDLLDVERIKEGKMRLERETFDLDLLVQEVIQNAQLLTSTHAIELEGATRVSVCADRGRIGEVLVNLIDNAVKYSPQADRVIVCLAGSADSVEVSVRDFGVGISKEDQSQVFNRFFQSDMQEKTFPGLGIGLYIAKNIIELHDGHIRVESEVGKGSTFSFIIPSLHIQ